MKECKDCGKKYDESLESCPRCGSFRVVSNVDTEPDDIEIEDFGPAFDDYAQKDEPVEEEDTPKKAHKEKREKLAKLEKPEKPVKIKKEKESVNTEVVTNTTDKAKANRLISKNTVKENNKAEKQARVKQEVAEKTHKFFTKQFWIGLGIGFGLGAIIEFAVLYATEIIKFY